MRLMLALLGLLLLAGCSGNSGKGGGRYSVAQDYGPSQPVDVSHVKDAVPRVEPKSRGGNPPSYTVLGKTYRVRDSADGYRERGNASWYGKKFHGHKTSNGEIYDMYAMTAAHKTLPLPTFVRVTNLANGRQVIVRVNDRGPFHAGRIIDLSYAAAAKLGMLQQGTATVEVEAIDPHAWRSDAQELVTAEVPVRDLGGRYLQVGAYAVRSSAERVQRRVQALFRDASVVVRPLQRADELLYRVQLGPLVTDQMVRSAVTTLEASGFSGPQLVDLP